MRAMLALIICLLAGSAFAAGAVGEAALPIGSTRTLNTPDGAPITLDGLKGRVVVVDFWATWCGPCVASIPHLVDLHEKYAEQGLVIIGHTDESSRDLEGFIAKHKVPYIISVGKDIGNAYGVRGIPHLVVVAPDGMVAWRGHPGSLDEQLIKDLVAKVDAKALTGGLPTFAAVSSHPEVAEIEAAIAAGAVAKGWAALEKLAERSEREPEAAAAATASIEQLQRWADEAMAEAQALADAGDVYGAWEKLEATAELMGRVDAAEPFNDLAKELRRHDDYRTGKDFAKFSVVPPHQRSDERFVSAVERFIDKYERGYYVDQARALLDP